MDRESQLRLLAQKLIRGVLTDEERREYDRLEAEQSADDSAALMGLSRWHFSLCRLFERAKEEIGGASCRERV